MPIRETTGVEIRAHNRALLLQRLQVRHVSTRLSAFQGTSSAYSILNMTVSRNIDKREINDEDMSNTFNASYY